MTHTQTTLFDHPDVQRMATCLQRSRRWSRAKAIEAATALVQMKLANADRAAGAAKWSNRKDRGYGWSNSLGR